MKKKVQKFSKNSQKLSQTVFQENFIQITCQKKVQKILPKRFSREFDKINSQTKFFQKILKKLSKNYQKSIKNLKKKCQKTFKKVSFSKKKIENLWSYLCQCW